MKRSLFLQNMAHLHGRTFLEPAGADGADGGSGGGNDNSGDGAGDGDSDDGDDGGDNDDLDNDGDKDDKGDKDGKDGENGDLTDKEAKLLKDMMRHKKRAKDSEGKLTEAEASLKALQEALGDKSAEDIKSLLKAQRDAETNELEKKGEYKRIVDQMREENKTLLADKDTELTELRDKLAASEQMIEDLTIGRAFGDSEFVNNDLTLPQSITRKEFGSYFDVVDGKIVGHDKPRGSSDRTPLVNSDGDGLSFGEAISKLVKSHPDSKRLLRSKQKAGARSGSEEKPGIKADAPQLTGLSRIENALSKK